jgi:hypothetical protein
MRFQFQRRGVPGKVYMVFPDRPGGRNLLLFFSMRPGPCARAAIGGRCFFTVRPPSLSVFVTSVVR